MKKFIGFMVMALTLILTCLSTTAFAATEPIEKQTDVKITRAYYYVGANDITLKVPNAKEFSSGKPVWQVQNADGTWSDIGYTNNSTYFKGCTYGLGMKNYTQCIGKSYRLKMINSTLNTYYYTVPYTLTKLTAPAYSSYISIVY
jgi:hypothetical protein